MKKFLLWSAGLVCVLAVLLVASWVLTWNTTPALEVGPATTVIEKPLRGDGTVDYVAALNDRYSAGITPENNAFVLIAPLIAPDAWDEMGTVRPRVFEQLGLELPGDDARYYQTFDAYAEREAAEDGHGPWAEVAEDEEADEEADEGESLYVQGNWGSEKRWEMQRDRALEGPWSGEDAPLMAEWLDANNWALEQVSEAAVRKRFWAPYVTEKPDDIALGVLLPQLGQMRSMVLGLQLRALHRLDSGDIEGAMEDALTIKRLSHHFVDTSMLIEQIVGVAISSLGTQVVAHIAADEDLTVEQARRFQAELASMHARFNLSEAINIGERYFMLDTIQRMGADNPDDPLEGLGRVMDRNQALRRVNPIYDRMTEAASATKPRAERVKLWEQLDREIEARAVAVTEPSLLWLRAAVGHRPTLTDVATDMLVGIMLPSIGRADTAVDRVAMYDVMEQVALGVAGYRAEHGEYPQTLAQLVPGWLEAVPVDLFHPEGEAVHYRVEAERVLIYSVNFNGEDNGGIEPGDNVEQDAFDLVIKWDR
ncbi:MAG: hypothetical protein WD294_12285 [Phycisphaeraceae bacterium]